MSRYSCFANCDTVVVFGNISRLLGSSDATPSKPFIYRCINLLVSALVTTEQVCGDYALRTSTLTHLRTAYRPDASHSSTVIPRIRRYHRPRPRPGGRAVHHPILCTRAQTFCIDAVLYLLWHGRMDHYQYRYRDVDAILRQSPTIRHSGKDGTERRCFTGRCLEPKSPGTRKTRWARCHLI